MQYPLCKCLLFNHYVEEANKYLCRKSNNCIVNKCCGLTMQMAKYFKDEVLLCALNSEGTDFSEAGHM